MDNKKGCRSEYYLRGRRKVFTAIVVCIVASTQLNLSGGKNIKLFIYNEIVIEGGVYAGWRSSDYGLQREMPPSYWVDAAERMASKFPDSQPGGIWILGVVLDDGSCHLQFPSPAGGYYPNIDFESADINEEYLDAFDVAGVKIWLQVESGNADIETLIDLVLIRYKHHSSVIGFGIDVEWREPEKYHNGRKVTNEEATTWLNRIKSYDPNYKLFLKHWLVEKMPTIRPGGLVFIDDSQDFDSLNDLANSFKQWGSHFYPSGVGFQIGYRRDKNWWVWLEDPFGDIGNALLEDILNCVGIYWVDFTILEVFAPEVLAADLNKDGIVSIVDIFIVARAYGTMPEDPNWNQIADLNNDEAINIQDITIVAREYGKTV